MKNNMKKLTKKNLIKYLKKKAKKYSKNAKREAKNGDYQLASDLEHEGVVLDCLVYDIECEFKDDE